MLSQETKQAKKSLNLTFPKYYSSIKNRKRGVNLTLIIVKFVSMIVRIFFTKEKVTGLVSWWAVRDKLPESIDIIILASFAATRKDLTQGSWATLERAQKRLRRWWGLREKSKVRNCHRVFVWGGC